MEILVICLSIAVDYMIKKVLVIVHIIIFPLPSLSAISI